ncbi:ferritin-like domain-containing protein [Metabacillus sp. cB07]|uniref:ferritin-like domain-containing protein n=1 Tax=Metabacillus sp. cB07 TaxID=2806989 RepID=UPI001939E03C|nr:ferritin-like domain-containing protein [Metabacillus sp. cB07]
MYYYDYYRQNQDEIKNIAKALEGEYNAIQCYEKLAIQAKTPEEKKTIQEIRQDEAKHYQTFAGIYQSLTGQPYSPKQTEECPADYISGLTAAIKDEQETVDFYHTISDSGSTPYIKEAFRRAAFDEQNHAVWFLYFLTQNK